MHDPCGSWRMSMPSALSRASFILRAVLLLCPVAVGATLREVTSEGIPYWREIREGALSADGQWLACPLTTHEGRPQPEEQVVMRGLTGKSARRHAEGLTKHGDAPKGMLRNAK